MKLRSSVLVISALGVALSGCGGSGSQGNETPASGNIYTGVVIDGPLQGATVFADTNRNGVKDPGEPETVTDGNGKYSLRVSANIYQPPVIVDVPPTAIDADTGKAVGKYYRLNAPDGMYSVISPITTMVRALIDVNPGLQLRDAERMVRGFLNLSDSYEIYADYTIRERPSGVPKDKWDTFLSESGRTHNIARVAAEVLGTYWANAKVAYGGSVSAEKVSQLNALLAEATLKKIAPLAGSLPNDGLVNLSELTITDATVSYEQLEAKMRKIALGVNTSLAQAVAAGDLHIVPFRTAAANYAHFLMKNGGSSNTAGQTVIGDSKVLLSDLTETDQHSLLAVGAVRKSVFQGAVNYDSSTGEDTLSDAQMVSRWRIVRMPVAGELQQHLYDPAWLKNTSMVWPDGAIAFKAIVKTSGAGLVIYEEDAARLYTGKLPETLYNVCCGTNSPNSLRLGDLAVRFTAAASVMYGSGGKTKLASVSGSTETPLTTDGSWTYKSIGVVLDIPTDYWSYLKESASDRLFSAYSKPNIIVMQLGDNKYTTGWQYPEGRYVEFVMLNTVAYNALKSNLKW